ncbi:MAG: adenylyl-sulfate kinase [Chitinophagales bacterium]|nr:adenylyl-sulfate kinase [Chitinophagales bacterium]
MSKGSDNIHPIFKDLLDREYKEEFLKQRAVALWFTGLSGSGKSTVAKGLEKRMFESGYFVQVLDGDNIRSGLNNNLGFGEDDRKENIRRIAEVSKLFVQSGIITLNTFVSPTREIRSLAARTIGTDDFCEIYINAPVEVCEDRDVKGLYKKARAGEITNFTGIQSPFEAPEQPQLEIRTDQLSIEESIDKVFNYILPKIELK